MVESRLKLVKLRQREKVLEHEERLLESVYGLYGSGWGSLVDPLENLTELGLVGQNGQAVTTVANQGDRQHGQDWPLWRDLQTLGRIRQQSRVLCTVNSFAKGLLKNLTNYVIGKGFGLKAVASARSPDTEPESPGLQSPEGVTALVEAVQTFLDGWSKASRFPVRQREAFRRVLRDGEAFVRLFFAEDGSTDLRFVEPEQVLDPPGVSVLDGWSFGIQHAMDPEDVETLVNYHAAYQDQSTPGEPGRMGDVVPASEMIHILPPDTDTTIKRGLPAFAFESGDALNRASKCQRYISIGSAVRAGTAEIWEHDYGTKQDIQDFADSTATRKQVSPYSGRDETLEHSPPGRIRRIPSGQKLVPPPSGVGTAEQLSSVQGDLRQASAGFTAPEYMTGDASNANYASTSMASAPFVKTGETDQEHYKAAFLEIVTRVISWAVSQGRLPEEATSWVTIQIESPAVIHQDKLQQSQVDQAYVTLGAKSIQTVQMEQGLDPEIEAANREQWHERFGAYTPLPMAFSDNPTQPAAGTDASNQPGN